MDSGLAPNLRPNHDPASALAPCLALDGTWSVPATEKRLFFGWAADIFGKSWGTAQEFAQK